MTSTLDPIPGDRWTMTLEVLSVKGKAVTIRRGIKEHTLTQAEYKKLAEATLDSGGTLERPEDPEFE